MTDEKNNKNSTTKNITAQGKKLPPEVIRQMFPAYANLALSEEEVNALSQKERVELLNNLDYRKKYQLLRKTDDMVRLLRQMPAEDLFFTTEAAGRTDSMDLILSSTPQQLTQIFDMTCWEGDNFSEDELLDWIGYMVQIDMERAIRKLRTVDITLIILMLSKYIKVWRTEWSDDRNADYVDKLMTFDDVYHFEILDPETPKNMRLAVFLKALYRLDLKLYTNIMETLVWELSSNLEEHNFRLRADRMSDQGYPEYLDSIGIFAKVNPVIEKKKFEKEPLKQKEIRPVESTLPVFYAEILKKESFLTRSLAALPDDVRLSIRNELVFLANKMLVARKSLTDLERAKAALEETHQTTSLGLEYLAEADINRALAALIKLPLTKVFQIGHSLTLDLTSHAHDFHANYIENVSLRAMSLISSPGREVLTSLLRKPPLFYTGADPENNSMDSKPFESLREIEIASMNISRIEFLFDLHFNVLALNATEIVKGRMDVGLDPLDPDMRLLKVFITVFANADLGLEALYTPLEKDKLSEFLKKWTTLQNDSLKLNDDFAETVNSWLAGYIQQKDENYQYLASEWARQCSAVMSQIVTQAKGYEWREAISLSQVLLMG